MSFPEQKPGLMYLTEGGSETEIMYKYGFEFPNFSAFVLLDNPAAMAELKTMYQRYLDVAAEHGFAALMSGLDYRASPDWANAAMMDKVSLCRLGHLEEGDPVELGQLMGQLAGRYPHIDIWGGCCGTWDKHLDLIAKNVAAAHG